MFLLRRGAHQRCGARSGGGCAPAVASAAPRALGFIYGNSNSKWNRNRNSNSNSISSSNSNSNSNSNSKSNNHIKLVKVQEVKYNGSLDRTISDCVICCKELSTCVFIPCGHMSCCYDCGCKIYLTRAKCSICNTSVRKVMRMYYDNDVSLVTK